MKRKYYIIILSFIFVSVLVLPVMQYSFRLYRVNMITKPYIISADRFFLLLKNEKFDEISEEFSINFNRIKLEEIIKKFGKLNTFHYKKLSTSKFDNKYTSLFLYYELNFEKTNNVLGSFRIHIVEDSEILIPQRLDEFEIIDNNMNMLYSMKLE